MVIFLATYTGPFWQHSANCGTPSQRESVSHFPLCWKEGGWATGSLLSLSLLAVSMWDPPPPCDNQVALFMSCDLPMQPRNDSAQPGLDPASPPIRARQELRWRLLLWERAKNSETWRCGQSEHVCRGVGKPPPPRPACFHQAAFAPMRKKEVDSR